MAASSKQYLYQLNQTPTAWSIIHFKTRLLGCFFCTKDWSYFVWKFYFQASVWQHHTSIPLSTETKFKTS